MASPPLVLEVPIFFIYIFFNIKNCSNKHKQKKLPKQLKKLLKVLQHFFFKVLKSSDKNDDILIFWQKKSQSFLVVGQTMVEKSQFLAVKRTPVKESQNS